MLLFMVIFSAEGAQYIPQIVAVEEVLLIAMYEIALLLNVPVVGDAILIPNIFPMAVLFKFAIVFPFNVWVPVPELFNSIPVNVPVPVPGKTTFLIVLLLILMAPTVVGIIIPENGYAPVVVTVDVVINEMSEIVLLSIMLVVDVESGLKLIPYKLFDTAPAIV